MEAIDMTFNAKENIGLFYTIDGETYVGIDNTTGGCWFEEFGTFRSCVKWLKGL